MLVRCKSLFSRFSGVAMFALAAVMFGLMPHAAFAQTPVALDDIVTAATAAATGVVSAAQIGILVVAGAVVALGLYLLRRGVKAGR